MCDNSKRFDRSNETTCDLTTPHTDGTPQGAQELPPNLAREWEPGGEAGVKDRKATTPTHSAPAATEMIGTPQADAHARGAAACPTWTEGCEETIEKDLEMSKAQTEKLPLEVETQKPSRESQGGTIEVPREFQSSRDSLPLERTELGPDEPPPLSQPEWTP